ncbi:hypothetical protein A5722_32310 [Mycobacterium vulneris]|nr:hypothetical protein A5722_32310 [Mycolicibacterium vulneris]OCB67828.1 hypothetical protein A5729_06795 [Mycolicibacterium vulneris]
MRFRTDRPRLSVNLGENLAALTLLEEGAYGNIERVSEIEEPFIEQAPAAEFYLDKNVASHAGSEC